MDPRTQLGPYEIKGPLGSVPAGDMVSLREEVAERVERGLIPALGARTTEEFGTTPANTEAYELYLRSMAIPREPEASPRAIDLLERAVELDPSYAPAWAALSRRYYDHGQYGTGGQESYERAFEMVERAVGLDPELIPAISQFIMMRTETGEVGEAIHQARQLVKRRGDSARARRGTPMEASFTTRRRPGSSRLRCAQAATCRR